MFNNPLLNGRSQRCLITSTTGAERQRDELPEQRRTATGGSWVPESVDQGQFNLNPHDYSCREEWMAASNLQSYAQDARERHPGAPPLVHN